MDKRLFCILSLMGLMVSSSIEGASYARRAAAVLGGVAYWSLTFYEPLAVLKNLKEKSDGAKAYGKYEEALNATLVPKTMSFLKKELEQIGLPDARIIPHIIASVAFIDDVCIKRDLLMSAEESFNRIEQAKIRQEKPLVDDIKTIQELQGVCNHEANHILHGDNWRILTIALGSALVPIGVRSAYRMARPAVNRIKKAPNIRKIMNGLINSGVSRQVYCAGSREIEQQADDAIRGHQRLLGMAYFLEKNDAELVAMSNDSSVGLWIIRHALTHPSPASRIERLKSRLQEDDTLTIL